MDVAIVGGGPSGLYLAQLLKGLDVKVFEEHNIIGYPAHCTGLVTKDVLKYVKKDVLLNKIKGAHMHIMDKIITVEKKDYAAYVIDRPLFDQFFYDQVSENVEIGERVSVLKKIGNKYMIKTKKENEFKIVVGADGSRSIIRKLVYEKNIKMLNGVQYAIKNRDYLGEYVHIFLERKYSDGFFSWVVPREDDVLVGLATYDNMPMQRIKSFIRKIAPYAPIIDKIAGQIPVGILHKHENDNIFLTGDAALFIKATSGGGLYYGLRGTEILAKSIMENSSYEKNLKGMLEELKKDYYIHKLFSKLDDKGLLKMISVIKNDSLIEIINEYGDIDRPFILSRKLLLRRELIPLYPLLFSAFFKSVLS